MVADEVGGNYKSFRMGKEKAQVLKWILQFLLSSFFAFVVSYYLNPRGSMGTQIQFMLFSMPFAITAGIILGDITLYTTRKFSFVAAIASIILSVLGFFFYLFLVDMSHKLPFTIGFTIYFSVLVLPSLIVYNCFSYFKRTKA
jgi:hypothetical protein